MPGCIKFQLAPRCVCIELAVQVYRHCMHTRMTLSHLNAHLLWLSACVTNCTLDLVDLTWQCAHTLCCLHCFEWPLHAQGSSASSAVAFCVFNQLLAGM